MTACRTQGDHRVVGRAVDDGAEDVHSNHQRNRSARLHNPSAPPPSAIHVVVHLAMRARTGDQRGAAPVPDRCVRRMRSARERPA
ncbi:MAG TPA: hypothetical protein VI056_10950 [Candidatus Limnocylindria bacterium]